MAEKSITYSLVSKDSLDGKDHYELLNEVIAKYHPELAVADFVIVYRYGQKPDKDGRLELAKINLCSEKDWVLHGHDFVLQLNYKAWSSMTRAFRVALLDHELCHATVDSDEEGNVPQDAHGRIRYRMRKHDLEEFVGVVRRHGAYATDVQEMAQAMIELKEKPILQMSETDETDTEGTEVMELASAENG